MTMGGKASKEEPKEEAKPPPVKAQVQKELRPTDGATGGRTLQRPNTTLDDVAIGGRTLQRSNTTIDEAKPSKTAACSDEDLFTRDDLSLHEYLRKMRLQRENNQDRPYTSYSRGAGPSHLEARQSREMKHTVVKSKKSSTIIVAAIDFGTTYSGYAYSFRENPNKIFTNYWEKSAIKTPTVVLLDDRKQFHSFGREARTKYEELMKTEEHQKWYLFERFKMKLFVQDGPLQKDMEIEDILGKPMKAITIFSEAIRYIRKHLLGVLDDPNREEQVQIEKDTDIHWVLTVPAIWNDLSKKFMREAAKNAGIPDEMLSLALEPEAASVFCKNELGIQKVPVGCRYLVLDLGGGTADITCHEVNSDETLKELIPPTGGDFGGTTVDNRFLQVLSSIFGGNLIQRFKKKYTSEYWELMSDFELKKRKFDGNGRVILKFPVRLLELYEKETDFTVAESLLDSNRSNDVEFKQGKMFLTENLMKDIFNSAVKQIIDKTAELLNEVDNIEHILLVGGFSESLYLQNEMKQNFDNLAILPKEPSGAVLRGAVMYGHHTTAISSRKCRYTYGIARMIKFEPGKHPDKKKVKMGDFTYCDDAFNKHIEVGTEVHVHSADTAKEHEYFPSSAHMKQAVLEVYKSPKKNPMFIDEEGSEFVGLIKVDIDPKGDIWSKLLVKLIFGGTELKIQVKDVKNGTITTAAVDFLG